MLGAGNDSYGQVLWLGGAFPMVTSSEKDIAKLLTEEGFKLVDVTVLKTKDHNEIVDYYDKKTGKWRTWVK